MATKYPRLDFAPHWKAMNENLIDLIDLVPEGKLDWSPEPAEWSIKLITVHIILARWHHIIAPQPDGAQVAQEVIANCRTKEGLKHQLHLSWDVLEAFLSDQATLDAVHGPPAGIEPEYIDPEVYDGHYVAYHRMAHDLHHRSTIIGHLGQLGISLDGHRVRPL